MHLITYLVHCDYTGTQPTMDTEYAVVNNSAQGKVIEYIATVTPHIDTTVFPRTFIIESIDLGDLPRFVVTAYESDPIRIPHFERQKKQKCFDRVQSTINEIT